MVQKSFNWTKRQTIQQLEKLDSTTRQNPASDSAANTNNKEEEAQRRKIGYFSRYRTHTTGCQQDNNAFFLFLV